MDIDKQIQKTSFRRQNVMSQSSQKLIKMPNRDDSVFIGEEQWCFMDTRRYKKKSMKSVLQELVRTCYLNILPDLSN